MPANNYIKHKFYVEGLLVPINSYWEVLLSLADFYIQTECSSAVRRKEDEWQFEKRSRRRVLGEGSSFVPLADITGVHEMPLECRDTTQSSSTYNHGQSPGHLWQ